jgi:hypothetical protein
MTGKRITAVAPLPDHMKRTWKTVGWYENDVPADPFNDARMTEPLKLVIFDVDGTLIDSQDHILAAMEPAFAAVGHGARAARSAVHRRSVAARGGRPPCGPISTRPCDRHRRRPTSKASIHNALPAIRRFSPARAVHLTPAGRGRAAWRRHRQVAPRARPHPRRHGLEGYFATTGRLPTIIRQSPIRP